MPDAAKSFADLLSELLADWRKFRNFLFLALSMCLLVFGLTLGLVYGILQNLPRETSEVKFEMGNTKGSILFSGTTKQGAKEYLIVIHPQGWQETGIGVKEGDALNFEVGGNVYIDLEGLTLSLDARHQAETRVIEEEIRAGRWQKEKIAPELRFTLEEKQKIRPPWTWVDANGILEKDMVAKANPARTKRAILPAKGYGALLGAIRETSVRWPSRGDVFFVGTGSARVANRSGKLYFAVNDVWNDQDNVYPEMFFVDNIGFFYVKVTVAPAK